MSVQKVVVTSLLLRNTVAKTALNVATSSNIVTTISAVCFGHLAKPTKRAKQPVHLYNKQQTEVVWITIQSDLSSLRIFDFDVDLYAVCSLFYYSFSHLKYVQFIVVCGIAVPTH